MAEEKPKSKGARRYENPRKITEKKAAESKPEAKEKPSDGKMAAPKDAQGTPSSANPMDKTNPGSAPKADVMAGTDGIPLPQRHATEREEMATRHAKAVKHLHDAHADEHAKMIERHKNDFGTIGGFPGDDGSGAATGGTGAAGGGA